MLALTGYRPPAPVPLAKQPGTLSLLLNLWRNPLSICGMRHFVEPIISEPTPIGHLSIVNAPKGVQHVLVTKAENYPKDARQLRILQPGLRTGLLTSSGNPWKVARHALAPLFTPTAVKAQAEVMRQCGDRMAQRLQELYASGPIDMSAELGRGTFDIISTLLFSDETQTNSPEFSAALARYFGSAGRIDPLDAVGAPNWIPRLGLWRARKAIRFFESLTQKVVSRRRAAIDAGIAPPEDLLTRLLEATHPETGDSLSEAEIAGSIITFIGAGHETTANALAWSLFLLAKHPSVLSAVEAELEACKTEDAARWPKELPLMCAVIDEAMRLYPPAPIMARTALADDKIMGVAIPKGSTIIIAPYIIHRHRSLWDEPDYFRPERFMHQAKEHISPYSYLPFGAGPRVCIGNRFSQIETVILLATLLRSFRFTVPEWADVFPVHHVTLRPSPSLIMEVTPRNGD